MILLRPFGGLCNRLRVMTSAIKLTKVANTRLFVFWKIDPEMNTRFSELFLPIGGVKVIETGYRNLFQRAVFYRHNPLMFRGACWPVRPDADRCARHIRPWSVSTCSEFYPNDDYSWVRPQPDIVSKVDEIAMDWQGGGVIGVHIRRTDNEKSCRYSPLDLFISRMRRELEQKPSVRFFLATDDVPTKDLLRREFGMRLLTRPIVAKREARDGVRDALVDLLLLSRCQKIFGSYWSSFSDVAAKLGKVPLEIIMAE